MTFEELNNKITALSNINNIDTSILGYSTMGQPIYVFHLGNYSGPQIFIEGGIHAREYPASEVVIGMTEYLANAEIPFGGIYIAPLVNPDGARLVLDGLDFLSCEKQIENILNINDGSDDFSQWKANINAVDLNVNFDALWGEGSQNVFCPAPGNFVGFYPESERETRALIDYTYIINPAITLSYHTKGNVIYYGFESLSESDLARDRNIADLISSINGYTPIKTENSVGGYSDFVSLTLNVPAFTIEVGSTDFPTPIPDTAIAPAIELNKNVPLVLLDYLNEQGTN